MDGWLLSGIEELQYKTSIIQTPDVPAIGLFWGTRKLRPSITRHVPGKKSAFYAANLNILYFHALKLVSLLRYDFPGVSMTLFSTLLSRGDNHKTVFEVVHVRT